ncbi:MAG: [protein-PII] uridylyltransferase [Bryobacteraceae bacterium]|nr:[protein-PII] uridylyltransferase [Bryobacteraceae bacterium]
MPHAAATQSGRSALTREDIKERFLTTGNPSEALAGRTEAAERIVIGGYYQHLAAAYPRGMAVLAVGGFGRRELFPHSDVDVLLLVDKQPSGEVREALSAFLRELWDGGLRLSHSVHTPRECCELHEQNIELNISLLDERFLAGDGELYGRLKERLPRFVQAQSQILVRRLGNLTRPRHARYQNTIYHLEPNIKETPGGLRDLHLLHWLDRVRSDLGVRSEWLESLERSWNFIASLRCFLHFRSGRDDNALSFDAQEEISASPFLPAQEPEGWMREYFFHARAIYRAATRALEFSEGRNSSLLSEFRNWRSRLSNADFTVSRERVFLKAPQRLAYDPELVMRLFQFVGRHGLKPALETERRIQELLPVIERHYAGRGPHWAALVETLEQPNASQALTAMHETGVLQAVFPEWKRIECLVVRDFYHRYTVDEHSLLAIRSLEDLRATTDPLRRRFAEILAEIEQPELLNLALLLHDSGKGAGGGHIEASLELAGQAMERIQMPLRERAVVRFLIERHLELSGAMTGRDLDDPSTAVFLAGCVETLERLKYLTLLTYADVSAVNPSAMSPWRLEQLWRVYTTAYRELTKELETGRIGELAAAPPEKAQFMEGFPVRYLRTHTPEEIDRHVQMERLVRDKGVAVDLVRTNGAYEVTILARDRPFLFASLAGALAGFGMNILRAEAFANKRGVILDTFEFEDPARTIELNPSEEERFCVTLERVALQKVRARDLLKNRPKPKPPSTGSRIQPRVTFDSAASEGATLVEIVAEDRPGLLYELSRSLSEAGCNIEVVLVDTEAHKAIDVFYVTVGGRKLTPEQEEALRQSLVAVSQP